MLIRIGASDPMKGATLAALPVSSRSAAGATGPPRGAHDNRQKAWRKTSAWFSVTPAEVVTTFRLSPHVPKRVAPLEASSL